MTFVFQSQNVFIFAMPRNVFKVARGKRCETDRGGNGETAAAAAAAVSKRAIRFLCASAGARRVSPAHQTPFPLIKSSEIFHLSVSRRWQASQPAVSCWLCHFPIYIRHRQRRHHHHRRRVPNVPHSRRLDVFVVPLGDATLLPPPRSHYVIWRLSPNQNVKFNIGHTLKPVGSKRTHFGSKRDQPKPFGFWSIYWTQKVRSNE